MILDHLFTTEFRCEEDGIRSRTFWDGYSQFLPSWEPNMSRLKLGKINFLLHRWDMVVFRRSPRRYLKCHGLVKTRFFIYLDPPRGAKWMVRGATKQPFRVQTPPVGGCWYTCLHPKNVWGDFQDGSSELP